MTSDQTPQDSTATIEELRALNERILDYARRADAVYLDTVEKTMRALADYQDAAAQTNDDQRMRALTSAYAQFTREVTQAYVSAARELRQ